MPPKVRMLPNSLVRQQALLDLFLDKDEMEVINTALTSPHGIVNSLIAQAEEDSSRKETIRDMVRLATSNEFVAASNWDIFGLWNVLTGLEGDYTGQSITDKPEGMYFPTLTEGSKLLKNPNLRDIYLGYQEQEMTEYPGNILSSRVQYKDYPIYDISPYSRFEGFISEDPSLNIYQPETVEKEIRDFITSISSGKTKNIPPGIKSIFGTNLDLGRFTQYVGRDEEGFPFLGVQDIWDFAGDDYSPFQPLMEALEVNPMNMYGRFYFNEDRPIAEPVFNRGR